LRSRQANPPISGIGLETSLQFASEGAHVVLTDINEPAAHKAAEYVNSQYPDCDAISMKCDVSREKDIEVVVGRAVEKFGRLDVMVSDWFNFLGGTGQGGV
jgi:NAD(P)-dependent dehydrogenase (short-subunit alcohol dehydrogenase family)